MEKRITVILKEEDLEHIELIKKYFINMNPQLKNEISTSIIIRSAIEEFYKILYNKITD